MTITESPAATALVLQGVSKTYGLNKALDGLDLTIRQGEIHALMGGNGSGKSTTVKVLAGVVRGDAGGSVTVGGQTFPANRISPRDAKEAGLHFVHQDVGVFPQFSVAENLAIGRGFDPSAVGRIRWRELGRRAERLLARFDLDVDPRTPLGRLGPAQRTLVGIVRALQDQENSADGVLVLDEPTAALSPAEVDLLLDSLRRYASRGQTILLISHRLDEVLSVADRVTVLRDGRLVETRDAVGLTPEELTRLMVGSAPRAAVVETGTYSGALGGAAPLVDVREDRDRAGYQLELRAGEVVGLAGRVGSGRSRLLRLLFGLHPEWSGSVLLDGAPVRHRSPAQAMAGGIALVPEDRAGEAAFAMMTVAENLVAANTREYWRRGRLDHRAQTRDAERMVAAHGVVLPSINAPLQVLSGGNQQKVILARWLRTQPRVLLLDEPTQGVDIAARLEIHRTIRRAASTGVGALVASSDVQELAQLCDRVLVLDAGTVVAERRAPDLDPAELAGLAYRTERTLHGEAV